MESRHPGRRPVEDIYLHVGEQLAAERRKKLISQRALSNFLGVSGTCVWTWETGRERIPLHRVHRVCEFLGVSLPELLERALVTLRTERVMDAEEARSGSEDWFTSS